MHIFQSAEKNTTKTKAIEIKVKYKLIDKASIFR